jgi:cis-L-3-hydroxyproline dehydratase
LAENRRHRIVLDGSTVFAELKQIGNDRLDMELLFPTQGHLCGTLSDGRVPIALGLEDWAISTDHLKAFCTASGTTGSLPLIHIAGVTPEAKDPVTVEEFATASGDNVLHDLKETFQLLDANAGIKETIDLVALGNPHLSVSKCQDLAQRIRDDGSRKHADTLIIACMSRSVHAQAGNERLWSRVCL